MSNLIHHNENKDLLSDISLLIDQSKQLISTQVNSAFTLLFWQIGKRINDEILKTSVQIMQNRLCRHCRHN